MKPSQKITRETRIGVLYGGLSNEREVSLRSGSNCFNALKRLGYENTVLIDVSENLVNDIKLNQVEIAFLCLHGRYGEDGTVQGLLELLKVPYTGSGVLSSALSMNKPLTKKVLQAQDLPFPRSYVIQENDGQDLGEFLKSLPKPPVMVKPLNEGSSVGVHKIDEADKLAGCVEATLKEFGGAIVENYVSGQEITIGVLEVDTAKANGNGNGNGKSSHKVELVALPILELIPKSKAGFYDYEAKYTKGMTEFVLPAKLSEERTKEAQELAKKTFRALNCSGYARVDMIAGTDGKTYILEVNTLPGMTDTSDLPAMAEVAGISYDALVEKILVSAGLDK
ncbi:MAG TPA: D-alanine--D-alanine ligase [Candidatus Obscuribacter sp.]|nr:D-alanine--D-alanine ligase [Candidatus Obscuribacter sp.]HNB18542.1 D-alanine--D-alanine ligase [Candidatus Obscuribacter sp.]HNG75130.1 D-alanine--D-alanine ligase [Candidatus Obscuribacter sp.]